MKRMLICLLVMLLLPFSALGEKQASLPDCFRIQYKTDERTQGKDKSFVSKEHIKTCQTGVDAFINGLVDQYDAEMSPHLKDAGGSPRRNSRLDIHVVHSLSGQSLMSFQVLARETYRRKQIQSPFVCHTFDMETGREIFLSDLFPEDSEAWDLMGEAVFECLNAYFPHLEADEKTLLSLCSREALQNTPFMAGPVCLSLHYEARILYPDQPSLMRVPIPYRAVRDMMTEYGRKQTDNSRYKMTAVTYDDGPTYGTTASLLNELRYHGAQATFFLVGDRIAEYADIVLRENDENHSLQSHHFRHTDTTKSNPGRIQSYTRQFHQALTETAGLPPRMLRPPYGKDEPFAQAKVNLPIIQWDVDTKDWAGRTSQAVLSVVKNETKDGSIILMHDIVDETPKTSKQVLDWLRDHGFLCVTVEDLFIHFGQEMKPNRVYYLVTPNEEAGL